MSGEHKPKRNRTYIILYSIALFSAAAIIILLSYLYSSRMEQSAEELEESKQLSVSALQSVEKLMADNQALNERLAEMEDELALLENELEDSESKLSEQIRITENTMKELANTQSKLDEITKIYNELLTQGEENND